MRKLKADETPSRDRLPRRIKFCPICTMQPQILYLPDLQDGHSFFKIPACCGYAAEGFTSHEFNKDWDEWARKGPWEMEEQ